MKFIRPYSLTLALLCGTVALSAHAEPELIFQENFDSQPDYTSTMYETYGAVQRRNGDRLPENWDSLYNGTRWSPEQGFPNNHASLEILGRNADKAKGGTGKSAVMWRESYNAGWNNWASDSQLIKFLPDDYEELYIEFYIRFSPNWWHRTGYGNWASKLFRVGHYNGTGNEFTPSRGDVGPAFLWGYKRDQYGVRNMLDFKGGPPGENYNSLPYGGGSLNYTSHTSGHAIDGGDPELMNHVTGETLSGAASHEDVFGQGDAWTKVAFYVRMNSSVGARDGVYRQWINDELIQNRTDIPWVMSNSGNRMVGWNYFAIGGNDYFQPVANSERFEDWYAIDDIKVSRTPLVSDGEPISVSPNPPTNLFIQ